MKQSNFTILRKLSQQIVFSFFFIATMLFCNSSIFANNATANIDLFLSSTQETCLNSNDGSVSVLVAGGIPAYTYEWNTDDTTNVVYNLTSGTTYTVTVTDSQGETAVGSIEVSLSPEGLWIMTSTDQDAGCGPNGIAHISAMTGVPPYTYLWSPTGQTTDSIFNLYPGEYYVTVTDSNGCTAIDSTEVAGEDGTSLGDFVFRDANQDGIQQPLEGGVSNVLVKLLSAGADGILYTDDDFQEDWEITGSNGRYIFECVEPGIYYIKFNIDTDSYNFSPQYQGNDDELDSNADPVDGTTESFSVFEGMPDDLSYDAGIYDACDDFTYGGTIGQSQIICEGEEPETLHTIIPPSGGSGTPEYLWLSSIAGGSFPGPTWFPIPNSNTENYDPGPLYVTTYFIRCIRREGCPTFIIESENQVTITVLPEDHDYCIDGNINGFDPEISAEIMAAKEVMIEWTTGPENELYYYYVERSIDAVNFDAVAVLRGIANNSISNSYHWMDTDPTNGRIVYRIKRLELISESIVYSKLVEVFFVSEDQSFMAHPNPVLNVLMVETSHPRAKNTSLSLYNAMGQLIDVIEFEAGETKIKINMNNLVTGLYFIHIPSGDKELKEYYLKVLKE